MLGWIAEHLFSSLAGWLGVAGLTVVACAAVAYIFPPFRRIAIEIAGIVIAGTAIYTKGNRDEAAKWTKAEDATIDKGNQARADAERDAAAGRLRDGEFDRDKGKVRGP